MQIIPAINSVSFEEILEKIKLVEPYSEWVHLDVADGTFTKNTLWHNASDLITLDTKLSIEAHLMIDDAEKRIDEWLVPGVARIIFHLSGSKDPSFVVAKCKKQKVEVGVSVAPDESLAQALAYKDKVNFFQILGVWPGLPGQKTLEETYERIKEVRKFCPSCIIEVDGGMNRETIPRATVAGADIIVAASAIFDSAKHVREAIKELQNYGASYR